MRVITGTARGRRLLEPEGMDTRPTTDRVKEGIFSSIQFEIEGRRVLDLFGGTGQMGIEAPPAGRPTARFWTCGRKLWGSFGRISSARALPRRLRWSRGTTWPSSPAARRSST